MGSGLANAPKRFRFEFDILVCNTPKNQAGVILENDVQVFSNGLAFHDHVHVDWGGAPLPDVFVEIVEPHLDLTKTIGVAPMSATVGSVVPFEVELTNSGQVTALVVRLTDLLPAGLTSTGTPVLLMVLPGCASGGSHGRGGAECPTGGHCVENTRKYQAISAGGNVNLAIAGGDAFGWGVNTQGWLPGACAPTDNFRSRSKDGSRHSASLAQASTHSLAPDNLGRIRTWGWPGAHVPGGTLDSPWPGKNTYRQIAGGSEHTLALRSDDTVEAWGKFQMGTPIDPPAGEFFAIAGGGSDFARAVTDADDPATPAAPAADNPTAGLCASFGRAWPRGMAAT